MFAKVSEVKEGTHLRADDGFTCIEHGAILKVFRNKNGELSVPCSEGGHSLDGQLENGEEYIGLSLVN